MFGVYGKIMPFCGLIYNDSKAFYTIAKIKTKTKTKTNRLIRISEGDDMLNIFSNKV